jgi:MFS transporter, MHS family, alpha-ketoglutarate permease
MPRCTRAVDLADVRGSLLVAVTPTYATIGVAAPILLVFARLLQGLSTGGEYGASATYLSEIAPDTKAGASSSASCS